MQSPRLIAAGLCAVFAASLSAPALAQLDPLTQPLPRTMTRQLDERLDRAERSIRELTSMVNQGRSTNRPVVIQPADTPQQIEALTARVQEQATRLQDLEETLRRVNGQLDNLGSELAAVRRTAEREGEAARQAANDNGRQLAVANARIDGLERQLNALTSAAVQQAANQREQTRASDDPQESFFNAMRFYTDGLYRASATAFGNFLQAHPSAPDAPEANYYLGQSLFELKDYPGAATAYIDAIKGWPKTAWAPDATVKLASSLVEGRKFPDACQVLVEFNRQYANASARLKTEAGGLRTRARCG